MKNRENIGNTEQWHGAVESQKAENSCYWSPIPEDEKKDIGAEKIYICRRRK